MHYTKPLQLNGLGAFNYVFNYTDHLEGGALKKCPVDIFSERARWREERVSFAKDPQQNNVLKILEENHYYPFGMKHQNYNVDHLDFNHYPGTGVALVPLPAVANVSYNYKYNGKELQEELGLNMYDFGSRNYDAALGRWMNIDPLAETSRRWSPYNYAYNNPIIFVDPDGMETERFDGVEYRGGHWSDAYRDTGSDNSNKENDDWIKNGNTAFYDPTIKTQKQAVEVYGEDAKRMGEGSRTYSRTDGVEDGRYSYTYHNDGTVTDKNGNQVDFSNGNLTTEGGTTIVNPESKNGSYFGIGIGGSLGGGISLEMGILRDATGNYGAYFSFGGNVGFSADAGFKGGEVTPTGNNPFGMNDFIGKSNSYNGGFGPFSGEIGGSDGSKEAGVSRMNPNSFGKNPRGYLFNNGGASFITPSPKISFGAQFTGSKTWVWDF